MGFVLGGERKTQKTMKGISEWALVAKPVAWFVSKFGTVRYIQSHISYFIFKVKFAKLVIDRPSIDYSSVKRIFHSCTS